MIHVVVQALKQSESEPTAMRDDQNAESAVLYLLDYLTNVSGRQPPPGVVSAEARVGERIVARWTESGGYEDLRGRLRQ